MTELQAAIAYLTSRHATEHAEQRRAVEAQHELVSAHAVSGAAATMLSMQLDDPTGYGRVVRDEYGADCVGHWQKVLLVPKARKIRIQVDGSASRCAAWSATLAETRTLLLELLVEADESVLGDVG